MPIRGSMNTGPILAFVDCEIDASAGTGGGSGHVKRMAAARSSLVGSESRPWTSMRIASSRRLRS